MNVIIPLWIILHGLCLSVFLIGAGSTMNQDLSRRQSRAILTLVVLGPLAGIVIGVVLFSRSWRSTWRQAFPKAAKAEIPEARVRGGNES